MNANKWEEIIYLIEEKFGIDERQDEDFLVEETHDGKKIMGRRETIEFKSPIGKIRVIKTIRPRVVDKRTLSNKRIGGKAVVDYIYSDQENSEIVDFRRWNEASQEWEEIKNIL